MVNLTDVKISYLQYTKWTNKSQTSSRFSPASSSLSTLQKTFFRFSSITPNIIIMQNTADEENENTTFE